MISFTLLNNYRITLFDICKTVGKAKYKLNYLWIFEFDAVEEYNIS